MIILNPYYIYNTRVAREWLLLGSATGPAPMYQNVMHGALGCVEVAISLYKAMS
jgi:hypothetical protein